MSTRVRFVPRLLLLICLVTAAGASAFPAGSSTFTYRRIFKSSTPEFIEIKIKDDTDTGSYEIRQLDEDPGATPFEISNSLRTKMFQLINQLNDFKGSIWMCIARSRIWEKRHSAGNKAQKLMK